MSAADLYNLRVNGQVVTAADPVPVTDSAAETSLSSILAAVTGGGFGPSRLAPVAGTFSALGHSATFTPLAGRDFNVSIWGTFVASVQLERSFDGGTTWLPITAAGTQLYAWTAPASESASESEQGVIYRLNCTAYTSGTVNYRISQ